MTIRPIRTQQDIDANTVIDGKTATLYIPQDQTSIQRLADIPRVAHTQHLASCLPDSGQRKGWYMSDSYADAVSLYQNGWPSGVSKADAIMRRLALKLHTVKPATKYRPSVAPVGGMTLNYSDIITSGVNPFVSHLQSDKLVTGRKQVKVCLNVTVSAGVETDLMIARGATVCALLRLLERQKITTSLDLVFYVGSGWDNTTGNYACIVWRVKTMGQEIDFPKLVFACAHPSAFRRILFAGYEHMPAGYGNSSGYGQPKPAKKFLGKRYDLLVDSDHMFSGEPMLWQNPAMQERWIKDQLQAQGVTCR